MEFQLLEREKFRQFLEQHPLKNFMQIPEIGSLRKKNGWQVYYVGVVKEKEILAASMLISHRRRFGCFEFYAPRGLLVDYSDKEVLSFFIQELKVFIKNKKGYILRIDPYYILRQRDIDGNIVEGGIDHTEELEYLHSLGFKKSKTSEQISWSFSLDLDKDLDAILKNMRTFTKRSIKKAKKNNLIIRDATHKEIPLVKEILDATCERKHFANRDLEYFKDLYQLLARKGNARFVLCDIPLQKNLDDLNTQEQEERETIDRMIKNGSTEGKVEVHRKILEQLLERKQELENMIDKYGEIVSASTGIFITYGEEVLYLFGGNRKEFMHFGCPHFIQWEMIQYAKKNGFKKYNFYGISGNFDPNDASYGVYDFKKGFTGYVEELIGEHELVISPLHYFLFQIIRTIKRR